MARSPACNRAAVCPPAPPPAPPPLPFPGAALPAASGRAGPGGRTDLRPADRVWGRDEEQRGTAQRQRIGRVGLWHQQAVGEGHRGQAAFGDAGAGNADVAGVDGFGFFLARRAHRRIDWKNLQRALLVDHPAGLGNRSLV